MGVKLVAKKAESAEESSEFGRTSVAEESGKVDFCFSCIIWYFCLSRVLVKPTHAHTHPYIFLPQKTNGSFVENFENIEKYEEENL